MARFLSNLLNASIHGSIVILAVILLRFLLRKAPKKYSCLLWLLAGLRLLMPIEIRSDLSLQPQIPLAVEAVSALPWMMVLLWIWAGVACCFGIYSMVSYLRLKNRVKEAVRIRGGWECDRIDTAFILGFIKPQIYIPTGMNHQSRKHILEHERTHLDKGDHWIKMIGFLALALHWFNPLVWAAYIMLCKDIEMACDERVVQFMELEERKSYSAALLSCSGRSSRFGASPVAFGEVSVKERILSVLNYKKPSFWISLLGVAAFFFVAVCLLTSPPEQPQLPAVEPLSPEQQAQMDKLEQCRADVEGAFSQEEFFYEILSSNVRGDVSSCTRVYRRGSDTMWTYTPSTHAEITEGRLELGGKHYAWQYGGWVETDTRDEAFDQWLQIFRWDAATVEYVGEDRYEDATGLIFTFQWEGEDNTQHTATATCSYTHNGNLQAIGIEQPDYENAARIHLLFDPVMALYEGKKTVSDFFGEAAQNIMKGMVTAEELAVQAEFNSWGILFRVDDDRLSVKGADISYSQSKNGFGAISTTDRYWLEKKVQDKWETVPAIHKPEWEENGAGVAKDSSTFGYLDWSGIYGDLEAGTYRMGKVFRCYDRDSGYNKEQAFYAEFEIHQSVDSSSPEAKAAVERCYAKLEELKKRKTLHWISVSGSDSTMEYWVNGNDYLEITHWNMEEPGIGPRVDTMARYQGVGYSTVREDPEVHTSKVLGMGLATLDPNRAGWNRSTISEDFNMSFFERSNHTISFPQGIGYISEEQVTFATNWTIAGGMECGAVLTYRFDEKGNLYYMSYQSDLGDGRQYLAYIEVFEDTQEQIDAKIRPYTENLIVGDFSWSDAREKYTEAEFNIRQSGFINTEICPITGPVEAARLALKEYPNLGEYLRLDVFRDESAGMWKVTVESYVDYQSTYGYRDIYLADNGVTCLLVYEGPIGWDEVRK